MKPRISRVSSAVTSDSSKTDGLGRRRVYVVCVTHAGSLSPRVLSASASSSSRALAASARAASALASFSRAFDASALASLSRARLMYHQASEEPFEA